MNDPISKILAILPNWLGDVVMCTPALRALHRRFPEAAISVAGRQAACDLVEGLPWIANRFPVEAKTGFFAMLRAGRVLRPHAVDFTVIFPHSFRAALLARLAESPRRIGSDRGGRAFLLTDKIQPYRENGVIAPVYMVTEYLDLVKGLGCEDDGLGPELRANPPVVEAVRSHFKGDGPRVGIAPGAAFGPSKLWPVERFARVADILAGTMRAQCALFTGPGEESLRDAFLNVVKTPVIQCEDGRPTIAALKAAISQLDLLICNDSGARHVAVAFHVPTVCIMGPTSPRYSEGSYERGRVLRVDVDCGPCQKPVCETDHRCMTRISMEWVAETASGLLRDIQARRAATSAPSPR
jgi:heptosyltransferase-2